MMKPLRILSSKPLKQLSEKLFLGSSGGSKDAFCSHPFASRAGFSTASQNFVDTGKNSDRVFVDYAIYKGKTALTVKPILPTFTRLASGGLRVDRRGALMMEFAPAVGERKYDWEKKQLFALSATEMGSLISLGPKDSCEFFHDPSMLSSNAGQVRKSLSVRPSDNGYFVSLSVVNNILKTNERFSVPVSIAEFAVMRTVCSYTLPHIMGWARYTSQNPTTEENSAKTGSPFLGSEWDK